MATDAAVVYEEPATGSSPRWLLVITGVLWILLSLVLLSFDPTSAATIGYLVGFVLIFAGLDELMTITVARGWKWLHGVLGAIFLLAGIASLTEPFQTFGILAVLIGWYLVIKGSVDIFLAIAFHREMPLWGLVLAVGIAQLLLGVWALGYPGRSAWLLVLWVGVGALLRGIGELVAAFTQGGDAT